MSDAQLAVIGLGSVGSMALWQASQRSSSVVGFEAQTPAHPRSAVGGDTRLFRMSYRGDVYLYPILQRAQVLWRELEAQSSHSDILNQCGGLSIGEAGGRYLPQLLESIRRTPAPHEVLSRADMTRRYPQHALGPDEIGVFDPEAGFLRTDRAVLSAIEVARSNGATVVSNSAVKEIRQSGDEVVVSTDSDSFTFDRAIVTTGGWSRTWLPEAMRPRVRPHRIYLTWWAATDPADFAPDRFPVFIRITSDRSLYGAPTVDGLTVKATLDDAGAPTDDASALARELTDAEVAQSMSTVAEYLPGLIPTIVRSDAYPDLYTDDHSALVGALPGSPRIYVATGFSGAGFKMSSAFGAIAAAESLESGPAMPGLEFLRPDRFVGA